MFRSEERRQLLVMSNSSGSTRAHLYVLINSLPASRNYSAVSPSVLGRPFTRVLLNFCNSTASPRARLHGGSPESWFQSFQAITVSTMHLSALMSLALVGSGSASTIPLVVPKHQDAKYVSFPIERKTVRSSSLGKRDDQVTLFNATQTTYLFQRKYTILP